MRVLYPARKEGIKNTGPPSGRSFGSSDSSSSNADISSTGSQKKEVFTTLEAQKFIEYDLNFDDPNEWVRRNSVADCIYQAMNSSARTMVEITKYEHRSGGQTVRLNYFIFDKFTIYFSQGVTRYPYVKLEILKF